MEHLRRAIENPVTYFGSFKPKPPSGTWDGYLLPTTVSTCRFYSSTIGGKDLSWPRCSRQVSARSFPRRWWPMASSTLAAPTVTSTQSNNCCHARSRLLPFRGTKLEKLKARIDAEWIHTGSVCNSRSFCNEVECDRVVRCWIAAA